MSITSISTVQWRQQHSSTNNNNSSNSSRLKLFSVHELFDYDQQQTIAVIKIH